MILFYNMYWENNKLTENYICEREGHDGPKLFTGVRILVYLGFFKKDLILFLFILYAYKEN
jgi:hypothetical protein